MWPSKFLPLEGQGSRKRDAEGDAPKTLYAIMADSWGSEWKWGTDTLSQGYKRGRQAIHRDIRAPAQTLAHIKEFTHLLPIPYPVFSIRPRPPASTSQRPCSSNGLTQPQSFLSEAQLRSPAPRKTESIQSWPLEPPLEVWRTNRAKGPTCYQLPPFHLPCQVKASPMTDTSFVVTACSPMQRTSQSPLYPSPDAHSTFISPTSCLV